VAAPLLTVTTDRSQPGAIATVKWDDEGVEPEACTIVKDGMLHDFLTTRESAAWIKAYYAATGRPLRSQGCATANSGLNPPLLRLPNLMIAPGADDQTFETLVAGLDKGLAIEGMSTQTDFQQRTGFGLGGAIYEVRNGKIVARIQGPYGFLFRVPELWKNLSAIGGAGSSRWIPGQSGKGMPSQYAQHSVHAVPVLARQLTMVDVSRRG
jgi:TldD protein